MKQFFIDVGIFLWLLFCIWIVVSWVDVLMHNDPITGDKQYMPGNAIVMITELAK